MGHHKNVPITQAVGAGATVQFTVKFGLFGNIRTVQVIAEAALAGATPTFDVLVTEDVANSRPILYVTGVNGSNANRLLRIYQYAGNPIPFVAAAVNVYDIYVSVTNNGTNSVSFTVTVGGDNHA